MPQTIPARVETPPHLGNARIDPASFSVGLPLHFQVFKNSSQVEVKSETDADWRRHWISALYLSVQSSTVDLQEEYLVYDFQVSNKSTFAFISIFIVLERPKLTLNHNGCFRSKHTGPAQ